MGARKTLQERFFGKVAKSDGCWEWQGSKLPSGYGQMWTGRKTAAGNELPENAHRVAYREFIGPIPNGMEIDHICRNRGCVNPAHLRAVTHRENMRVSETVMGLNARKMHCKRDHPLSGDNLKITRSGARQCRTCANYLARESKRRRRGCA